MSSIDHLPLEQELFATPERFSFAQVIDLLEHIRQPAARMGAGTDRAKEALAMTADFGLAFRTGAIAHLAVGEEDGQPGLAVNFFGLGGAQGPLPEPFVELVMEQQRSGGAAAEFLAIFQHRLLSFVYRCENEFRSAAPFRGPDQSALMPALAALLGLPAGRKQAPLAAVLLAHAGIVVQQRRSMTGLLALLASHFGVAVDGCEFAGCWTALPDQLQTVLGSDGRNDLLGQGAVLGRRAWDQNGAIEISFAPMPLALYTALLPGGGRHHELADICAFYLGLQVRCYAHLELEAVPEFVYQEGGADVDATSHFALGSCILGHTAWLAARARPSDPAQRRVTLVLGAGTENLS